MEDLTMNSFQMLTSYGALGICCVYFMVKDWVRAKKTDDVINKNTEALNAWTIALNAFIRRDE